MTPTPRRGSTRSLTVTTAVMIVSALATMTLAGCGIPAESSAREVDAPRGPYEALDAPTLAVTRAGAMPEQLYFISDGALVPVTRRVDTAPTIDSLVRDLLSGPTGTELEAGVTSALPGTNVIAEVRLTGGEALVELGTGLEGMGRSDEVLAFAQVVCTLATLPEVSSVSFIRGQQRVPVPRGDGSLSQGPLTLADYADLIAER